MNSRPEPGMYLVGRMNGNIEPFFAQVFGEEVIHHVSRSVILAALDDDGWWWHSMDVPDTVPDTFDDMPRFPKKRGDK